MGWRMHKNDLITSLFVQSKKNLKKSFYSLFYIGCRVTLSMLAVYVDPCMAGFRRPAVDARAGAGRTDVPFGDAVAVRRRSDSARAL